MEFSLCLALFPARPSRRYGSQGPFPILDQGSNLGPPAAEAWSPNHSTAREFPGGSLFIDLFLIDYEIVHAFYY